MEEVRIRIENMHCDSCVRRVSQALAGVPGVRVGEVRVGGARVEIPETLDASSLVGAVERVGYRAFVEE